MNVMIKLATLVVASAASAVRASSLPDGYERVEHIESSGTQYIDTGVEPDATTIVTVDWLSPKEVGESFQVFVGTKDANSRQMTAMIGSSNNLQGGVLCASGAITPDVIWDKNARHTVTLDAVANAISFDGRKVKDTTPEVASLPSIYLFARHSPTADAENFASGWLYGCTITKGGELVRDYVPCLRRADGVFGLYDLKGGGFCGNNGKDVFRGPIPEREFNRFFRRIKGVASTGGAYVDTEITPRGRVPQVDLTYRFTDIDASQSTYVFGCWNSWTQTGTAIGYQPDPFLHRYRVYDKSCDGVAPTTSLQTVSLNGPDGTRVNGEVVSAEMHDVRDEGVGFYYVFARHIGGEKPETSETRNFANAIVFTLKISMDGVPVRDFVPCVRREDGAVGFYDRVAGRFFGKSGTGSLIPVEEASSVTVQPYLESSGAQYIDTGVEPDATTIVTVDWLSSKEVGESFQVFVGTKDANSRQMTAGIGSSNNLQGGVLCASGAITPDVIWDKNARHTVTLDAVANAISFDGRKVKDTTPEVASLPSIYLFARHSPTAGAENFASGRLYGCTITKGGVLVRDYVAARRNADGALGLYDRVFGAFRQNRGTGSFSALYKESEMRRLQYVESTGAQWIATEILPRGRVPVVKMRYAMADTADNKYVFGYYNGSKSRGTAIGLYDGKIRYRVSANAYSYGAADLKPHLVEMNTEAGTRIDGNLVETALAGISDPEDFCPYFLFARSSLVSDSPPRFEAQPACARIYSFSLSLDGDEVLDLLPVKRRYDGRAGLWNRLTGKAYWPQGGELKAGPAAGGLIISIR